MEEAAALAEDRFRLIQNLASSFQIPVAASPVSPATLVPPSTLVPTQPMSPPPPAVLHRQLRDALQQHWEDRQQQPAGLPTAPHIDSQPAGLPTASQQPAGSPTAPNVPIVDPEALGGIIENIMAKEFRRHRWELADKEQQQASLEEQQQSGWEEQWSRPGWEEQQQSGSQWSRSVWEEQPQSSSQGWEEQHKWRSSWGWDKQQSWSSGGWGLPEAPLSSRGWDKQQSWSDHLEAQPSTWEPQGSRSAMEPRGYQEGAVVITGGMRSSDSLRLREGTGKPPRFGNRGGKTNPTVQWFCMRAEAQKRGPEALKEFHRLNPKPMKEDPDWLEMRALATRQVEAGEEDALEKFFEKFPRPSKMPRSSSRSSPAPREE